jgi:RNA polymerase sigma-70 factor (ECF subfamily)
MEELYRKSGGEQFGLSRAQFDGILKEIGAKYLPAEAGQQECSALYGSLRAEELALARACAAGHEAAWEIFLRRYRTKLYAMATGITREESAARELADSLYADLYGTEARDGRRISKLASYTGRGSLEGWLRTVMTQEHVNRYRRRRRLVSLDEEDEKGERLAAPDTAPVVEVDARLEKATDQALAALPDEERFMLAAYYLDGHTLAEIAGMIGVHESTVSRKLDRVAKSLRKQILASLILCGMTRRQAEDALEVDVRDLGVNIRGQLSQNSDASAFPKKEPGRGPAREWGRGSGPAAPGVDP